MTAWTPAGAKGQPTRQELAARHTQHEVAANVPAPRSLAPGVPGVSGPNGVRQASGGTTTGWNGKLSGL
jgi:hypothetical protein